MSITVGTYNILNPKYALDYNTPEGLAEGKDNWESRKNAIVQNIKNADLDILAITEIGQNQLNSIKADLEKLGYGIRHASHFNKSAVDGVAVIYKVKKFKLLDIRSLGAKDAKGHDRRALFVDLQYQGKVIRVASCHMRGGLGKGKADAWDVQCKGLHKFVSQKSKKNYQVDATVVAGDFNRDPSNIKFQVHALTTKGFVHDGSEAITENPNKYHKNGRKIDWVFAKGSLTLSQMTLKDQDYDASDHRMCASRLNLKNQKAKKTTFTDYFNPKKAGRTTSNTMVAFSILTVGLFALALLIYSVFRSRIFFAG